ncbi:urocanate hydratase [Oscillatoria nigro-viridis PCC 7112]|uniref:Urocanate hydratase n=1 Tax=Phormidium nigroviride PCC 7112 TaxID=179408 RepID=K9VJG6_9CYAN|nr:hypothetical protein [Oscillatoria nigro-viridis]AFZ07659.1 urocanate hydratase [Oscillatoria nigro-viridis PCC 7112]
MTHLNISPLNRRSFLSYVALGTLGLLTKDLLDPASAMADSEGLDKNPSRLETYHIFVPYTTARNGGKETFTLRSGEPCQVAIPSKAQDSQEITIKGRGQDGKDITVVLHTLYDRQLGIKEEIYQEIDKNTQFIKEVSKAKCKFVYEQIEDGEYINDVIALDFLDYVIGSSKLDKKIKERYEIASNNSRLLGTEQAIEMALSQSKLTEAEKKLIRGTFASVRASEPVPDFKALTEIDSIVAASALPLEIKQYYLSASTKIAALTVDFILVKLIEDNQKLTPAQPKKYLSTYQQVRAGKRVEDAVALKSLDSFISNAEIPENAKVVYSIAREQNLDNQVDIGEKIYDFVQAFVEFKDRMDDAQDAKDAAKKAGAAIVPIATKILSLLGVRTATGVTISSLSGVAATNATLAVLGGGSVASGGLGMLGGLAVVTGGAALIGAAGVLSIALVSEMDSEDQKNLGIAIGTGTVAATATVLAAWTVATALEVAGTLSGAAAITATISALGGLGLITGGTAVVAGGVAIGIWSYRKSVKTRDSSVLHQLETRTYTYTENIIADDLGEFLQKNVSPTNGIKEGFSAPNIPLDKLSKALSSWLCIDSGEKVIALIDNSFLKDAKEGVVFTNAKMAWKIFLSEADAINYENLAKFVKTESKLTSLLSDAKQKQELSKLKKVVDILSDEKYSTNLSKLQELVAIVGSDKNLSDLVSNEKYKNKLPPLKNAVAILSDEKYSQNLSKLKDVVDVLSNEPDLGKFLSSQLVSQLSDKNYTNDLSRLKKVVDTFQNESDKENFTKLLRQIGQKYSTV